MTAIVRMILVSSALTLSTISASAQLFGGGTGPVYGGNLPRPTSCAAGYIDSTCRDQQAKVTNAIRAAKAARKNAKLHAR